MSDSIRDEEFLTGWATISLIRRSLLVLVADQLVCLSVAKSRPVERPVS